MADLSDLSKKEIDRRNLMLSGNQFRAILTLSLPLVFYAGVGQIFQLIDTVIASSMSANTISTVSFVGQLEKMLMSIATALSVGGGVMIARSFGSGEIEKVRQQISTLFFIAFFIGAALLAIIIPLMYPFLRLFKMPEELIGQGTFYSVLVITSLIFQFINTIYFAVQKARGNTKVIMLGNLLVLFIKTSLNLLIIRLINHSIIKNEIGIYFLPLASLLAHLTLTLIAVINMTSAKNPFRISFKSCQFKKHFMLPFASLSIPVFFEKFLFAFGKAIVNTLCTSIGPTVVGALGVSDRICALATNPIGGFQSAESSLISNNLGNKNLKRAVRFFYLTLILTMSYVIVFFIITGIFKESIIATFAKGDAAFADQIHQIYRWERLDTVLNALNVSVLGLLYGFGKTKISMVLNTLRLFIYRIPILILFLKTPFLYNLFGLGGVGIIMVLSNGLTGITAGIVSIFFIRKELKKDRDI